MNGHRIEHPPPGLTSGRGKHARNPKLMIGLSTMPRIVVPLAALLLLAGCASPPPPPPTIGQADVTAAEASGDLSGLYDRIGQELKTASGEQATELESLRSEVGGKLASQLTSQIRSELETHLESAESSRSTCNSGATRSSAPAEGVGPYDLQPTPLRTRRGPNHYRDGSQATRGPPGRHTGRECRRETENSSTS